MLQLRYDLAAELRANRGVYDLAKAAKYLTAFTYGRARGLRPLIDDPYMVFTAEWLAERLDCRVVMLVRHPGGHRLEPEADRHRLERQPARHRLPARARAPLPEPHADELERAAGQPLDPIAHGALLWLCIHTSIAQQLDRHPDFIMVRYEDLATDPLAGFRDLYERLDLPFTSATRKAVRSGSMAGPGAAPHPWGRVGMAATAYQPMESGANAWAWRDRLSAEQVAEVIERTRDVAEGFYTPAELRRAPRWSPRPRRRPRLARRSSVAAAGALLDLFLNPPYTGRGAWESIGPGG